MYCHSFEAPSDPDQEEHPDDDQHSLDDGDEDSFGKTIKVDDSKYYRLKAYFHWKRCARQHPVYLDNATPDQFDRDSWRGSNGLERDGSREHDGPSLSAACRLTLAV